MQTATGRALRTKARQFLVQERARVMRVVEQPSQRRLCRDAHEHQLARRHGCERGKLRRGPTSRGGAEQVLGILGRMVGVGVAVTMAMAMTVFFRCWLVVVIAVRERDHDGRRVQVRFVVRQARRWTHVYS